MRPPLLAAIVIIVAAPLAGCGDGDGGVLGISRSTQNATVRFVNASAAGTRFDVLAGDQLATGGSGVDFAGSTGCLSVNAATPDITLLAAGTSTQLAGFSDSLVSGQRYTVIVTGTGTLLRLTDDFTTPSVARTRLRVVNVTSSGSVDVYVTTPNAALGTPAVTNLAANASSLFLDVAAGATQVRLTTAGTQTVIFDSGAFTLASRQVLTLVVGDPAQGSTALRSFTFGNCP
jgi:hypothetical protein